jgi:hypothetical protein
MAVESVSCPLMPGHGRTGRRLTPLSVTLRRQPTEDFVWTWYSECLVTQKVVDLFRSEGFTGYDLQPVTARLQSKAGGLSSQLRELVVTGWAGIARRESGVVLVEECSGCGLKRYSCFNSPEFLIDSSNWDGTDFFMVWPLPKFIFVTDRVAAAVGKANLRGARLVPLHQLHCEGTLGGGRLSYWMPEERAHELGDPLGIY